MADLSSPSIEHYTRFGGELPRAFSEEDEGRDHKRYPAGPARARMVQKSTVLILAGVVLLFLPVPPIMSAIAGLAVIALGVALRFVGDD